MTTILGCGISRGTPSYTINVDAEFEKTLSDLMSLTGASSKADVIANAVSNYKFLVDQRNADKGSKVAIIDANDVPLRTVNLR